MFPSVHKLIAVASCICILWSQLLGTIPDASAKPNEHKERFALLIGINDYLPTKKDPTDDSDPNDLNGCTKDVADMRKLLSKSFGFENDDKHIKTLTNSDATADAIVGAFRSQLIANAKAHPNGVFVFQFSGHGATGLPTRAKDEPDGYNECIVAADLRPVVDDQIAELIKELSDVTTGDASITIIFDCCHSGTTSRLVGSKYRQIGADTLNLDKVRMDSTDVGRVDGSSELTLVPVSDKSVIISACNSVETEPETTEVTTGERNGVLTRNLIKILENSFWHFSYVDLRERLSSSINADYGIHPQVVGRVNSVVFSRDTIASGSRGAETDPYIPIKEVLDDGIIIGAGQAQGLASGGIIAVYAPEATVLSGKKHLLAQGTISDVDSVTAKVLLPKKVSKYSKAILVTPNFGSAALKVKLNFDKASAKNRYKNLENELEKSLNSEQSFRNTSGDTFDIGITADTFKQFQLGASRYGDDAKTVQSVSLGNKEVKEDDVVLFVTAQDAQPLFNFCVPASDPDAVPKILEVLRKRAKQQSVLALTNATDSPINNAIEVKVLRVELDQNNKPIKTTERAEDQHGRAVFKKGEHFLFELTNKSDTSLFVNLLNIGTSGAIYLLLATSSSEPLAPHGVLRSPLLELDGPQGIDTFKIVATKEPANFDFLRQDSADRGVEIHSGLPQMLFEGATRVRSLEVDDPPGPDDWGVVTFETALRTSNSKPGGLPHTKSK